MRSEMDLLLELRGNSLVLFFDGFKGENESNDVNLIIHPPLYTKSNRKKCHSLLENKFCL